MQCSHKITNVQGVKLACFSRAIIVYNTIDKYGKPLILAKCSEHATDVLSAIYAQGKPCVFCERGFIATFRHIARGNCFRCNATGISDPDKKYLKQPQVLTAFNR